jgi:hypothetical protein
MSKFLNNISLNDNQIQNFVIQNAPAGAGITAGNRKGAAYFDSTSNLFYVNDGTRYVTYAMVNTNGTVTVGSPVAGTDAANKTYVDNAVQGISAKDAVEAATVGNITLAGGAPNTVDGVGLALGSRILVKNQTLPAENGIYYVTTLGTGVNGTWARAYDMDAWSEVINAYVLVTAGTANANSGWVVSNDVGTGTLGSTAITWVQFSQAGIVTGANVGSQTGTLFRNKTGNSLNFKTISGSGTITITNNADSIDISSTGGGSVTGATFTAGLISVTGSTTLAFTVAGTSGGIPYFSSATGWGSSAALAQYSLIVGGGAGAAPVSLAGQGTTGQVLLSGNGAAAPSWGQVTLTTGVTGVLPIANGGTGQTTLAAAGIPRKYAASITGATGGVWTVAQGVHGLVASTQIQAQVQSAAGEIVYPDITVSSAGLVTVTFATNPVNGDYTILLIG